MIRRALLTLLAVVAVGLGGAGPAIAPDRQPTAVSCSPANVAERANAGYIREGPR